LIEKSSLYRYLVARIAKIALALGRVKSQLGRRSKKERQAEKKAENEEVSFQAEEKLEFDELEVEGLLEKYRKEVFGGPTRGMTFPQMKNLENAWYQEDRADETCRAMPGLQGALGRGEGMKINDNCNFI
jgi:hypothetical protein